MHSFIKAGIAAIAVGVVGFFAAGASADTISTGVAGWKFVDYSPLPGANVGSALATATNAAEGNSAVSIAGNGAWVTPPTVGSTPGLSWISALSDGASNGLYGLYTYELKLDIPPLVPGTYQIAGRFSSDNVVDSFTVNGSELLTNYVGLTEQSYQFVYTLPLSTGNSPLTLRARIYNESTAAGVAGPFGSYPVGPNAPSSTTNPTGFILDGQVSLVPLPPAAFAGAALMGFGGLSQLVRRRKLAAE